jgi:hypothetical protein
LCNASVTGLLNATLTIPDTVTCVKLSFPEFGAANNCNGNADLM